MRKVFSSAVNKKKILDDGVLDGVCLSHLRTQSGHICEAKLVGRKFWRDNIFDELSYTELSESIRICTCGGGVAIEAWI